MVSNLGRLFQAVKSLFQELDSSYTIFKYGWLHNINFFIEKFIKKGSNNIHLVDTITLFYKYTHHTLSWYKLNYRNKSFSVIKIFLLLIPVCNPSSFKLQNLTPSIFLILNTQWHFKTARLDGISQYSQISFLIKD